jgi:hypothetical protein
MTEKLSKAARLFLLDKIAKKAPPTYGLKGKHNKKSLEKKKNDNTSRYKEIQKELEVEQKELDRLSASVEEKKNELKNARKDIMDAHDLLRNMDFAGANEARVGNDADDISYACDGKWVHYDLESGVKEPYSKWKKAKNPTVEIIEESDDVPEEVNDIDDPDGIDVTV